MCLCGLDTGLWAWDTCARPANIGVHVTLEDMCARLADVVEWATLWDVCKPFMGIVVCVNPWQGRPEAVNCFGMLRCILPPLNMGCGVRKAVLGRQNNSQRLGQGERGGKGRGRGVTDSSPGIQ